MIWHILEWKQLPDNDHMNLDQFMEGKVPDHVRKMYTIRQKDFELRNHMLYVKTTPSNTNDKMLAFVVPRIKCRAALNRCH